MIKELDDKILQLQGKIFKKCKKSHSEYTKVWVKDLTPILINISKTEENSPDNKLYYIICLCIFNKIYLNILSPPN